METQLLFYELPAIMNGGEDISSRAAYTQKPENYSVGMLNCEPPCPTTQYLNTAYDEGKVNIQSEREQKVDVVALLEMEWRSSWGRRAGEGCSITWSRNLVQTKQKWLSTVRELPPHLHSNCITG